VAVWLGKKQSGAWLFSRDAWLFLLTFFTFCYFLLLFLLVVSFVSYFLLVKGVSFVTFCYFFTGCNFDKLLFTVKKGQGEGFYSLCEGGTWKGAGWFFFYLFYCWRGGGWKLIFFSPQDVWKGGRRRGERGTFRFLEMFLSREGFTGGNFFLQVHYGTG